MRFARAKGSKASNARVPESATPWQEMKQGIIKNKNSENIESPENNSRYLVKTFNASEEKAVKWSEFPIMDQEIKKHKANKKSKTKQQSANQPESQTEETAVIDSNTSVNRKRKVKNMEGNSNEDSDKKSKKKRQSANLPESQTEETAVIDSNTSVNYKRKVKNVESNSSEDSGKKSKKKRQSINQPESQTEETTVINNNKHVNREHKEKDLESGSNKNFDDKVNRKQSKKLKRSEKQQEIDAPAYKRRKPYNEVNKVFINGEEVEIVYYDNFPIKKADAERLKKLKKEMISKGLPRSEVAKALRLERRRAEKSLSRDKKKVCFNCRQSGHTLSECSQLRNEFNSEEFGTGICFKCGSTEHTHFECKVQRGDNFKFAQCFICKEQGHIARQCPDNSRGLYPKGGACKVCGDVTHLKKDCPKYQSEQEEQKMVVDTIDNQNIESLGDTSAKTFKKSRMNKVIKFN